MGIQVPELNSTAVCRDEDTVLLAFHRFKVFPDDAVKGRSRRSAANCVLQRDTHFLYFSSIGFLFILSCIALTFLLVILSQERVVQNCASLALMNLIEQETIGFFRGVLGTSHSHHEGSSIVGTRRDLGDFSAQESSAFTVCAIEREGEISVDSIGILRVANQVDLVWGTPHRHRR